MLIHVDFSKLENHLHILERELTQQRQNTELLNQWRLAATIQSSSNLELIEREIRFMELQMRNTRNRKNFLENMEDLLRRANYHLRNEIASAEDALKQLR